MRSIKLVLAILLLCSLVACRCVSNSEIENWSFGNGANATCPLFGGFPILVYSGLQQKYNDDVNAAIARWNKVAVELGVPMFFTRKETDAPKATVMVVIAPESEELCEHLKLGVGADFQNSTFAYTEYKIGAAGWSGARVSVCVAKYEAGLLLTHTAAAQQLREMRMYGILLHEFGHLLIGPEHLGVYGEIMKPSPRTQAISWQARELLRIRVVEACAKNHITIP